MGQQCDTQCKTAFNSCSKQEQDAELIISQTQINRYVSQQKEIPSKVQTLASPFSNNDIQQKPQIKIQFIGGTEKKDGDINEKYIQNQITLKQQQQILQQQEQEKQQIKLQQMNTTNKTGQNQHQQQILSSTKQIEENPQKQRYDDAKNTKRKSIQQYPAKFLGENIVEAQKSTNNNKNLLPSPNQIIIQHFGSVSSLYADQEQQNDNQPEQNQLQISQNINVDPGSTKNRTIINQSLLKNEQISELQIIKETSKEQTCTCASLQLADGSMYEGDLKNGIREGTGKQVWLNGDKYEGEFLNNSMHNKGQYWHNNGDQYSGQWREGKRSGYGIFTSKNFTRIYKGLWLNNFQEGQGVESWKDGSKYEGEYKGGKKHGKGTYTFCNKTTYEGDWVEDKMCGEGVMVWQDSRKYEGGWLDNLFHKQGIYKWSDGREYVGEYKHGLKHGKGIYTWADGCKYDGEWENGVQHGQGQYILPTGEIKLGQWERGKRVSSKIIEENQNQNYQENIK